MMFLIRTAFWLSVVIMLIPVDTPAGQQAANAQPIGAFEAAGAAQQALNDVSGFCTRNPTTCAVGERVGTTFMLKARTGARIISTYLDEKLGSGNSTTADVNRGTLNSSDLAADWQLPRKAPSNI